MGIVLDPDQVRAEAALRGLALELGRSGRARGHRWVRRRRPRGVYLWGRPGRGKTWLMDRFLDDVGGYPAWRVHFHEFLAAPHVPQGVRLLCFDEFHVHDVGDALFLRRMLDEVARRGITLVATSNYPPERLLPNPLHHHHVVPAVEAIRASMDVLAVDGPLDYRARGDALGGFASGHFTSPGSGDGLLPAGLTPPLGDEARVLDVHGRGLRALSVRGHEVWFDFRDLCVLPVSVTDYLELSRRFSSWVVVRLPHLDETTTQAPQRLANLVDVLHDRDLALHLACDVGLSELRSARQQPLDPGRTYSRLSLLRS